jgi:23S rRNA (uracil1939-C5)-methyltransferase
MVERLVIDDIGRRGDGITHAASGAIYVPYALPGETVEVGSWPGHPDRRALLRVETASPARIAPICPHFGTCGGCALQHWATADYRAWKRTRVVEELGRVGIEVPVGGLIDAHGDGRRRAVLHARRSDHDVLEVGFAALHAHRIVPIDRCPILAPGLAGAINAAWAIAEVLQGVGKPLDIQATATDVGIDIDVRGSGSLTPQLTSALAGIAETHHLARITRHGERVAQRVEPTIQIGRAVVALPPGAFLQATALGEETLAKLVLGPLDAAGRRVKTVADLFAGIGPFALRVAERARVVAADSDEDAIDALRRAAAATTGLKPIDAQRRDLFRRPFVAAELTGCDAVVFDPPRQGAEAQARELAKSRIGTIIAVSCNAATFARDAKILIDGGYRLDEVTPVDQFRYSFHVEIVARFSR